MKAAFTLFFALLAVPLLAQNNFVPGHYINPQGERVDVYINNKNWDKSPTAIKVKYNLTSRDIQTLTVSDIKSFALSTGDIFESHIVQVEHSTSNLSEVMLFNRDLVVATDTVFLRALVKGAVSLFHLQYEKGEPHYFIQKGDEVPVELVYRTTRLENKQQVGFTKVPVYKGMLTVKLADCDEVSKKINGVEFSRGALTRIIQDYNKCMNGNEGDYLAKEENTKFTLAAVGGITYNFIKIKGDADEKVYGTGLNGIGYTAGASFQLTFPRNHGRYSLLTEVMYKPLRVKGATYKEVHPSDEEVYVLTRADYNMDYVGLNILGRYMFGNPSKIRTYINAGLGNNLLLANNSSHVREVHIYSVVSTYENQLNVRKFEESLILGVGAESKRFSSEIRYERGSGFSPVGEIKTFRSAISLKFGYTLFRE